MGYHGAVAKGPFILHCNCVAVPPLFLKHCGIEHLKNQTVPWFETFTECTTAFTLQTVQIHEKIIGQFFARGQNVLYNAQVLRL